MMKDKYRIKVESLSGEYWSDDLYTLKDGVYWDSDGDYGIPSECVIDRELIKESEGV